MSHAKRIIPIFILMTGLMGTLILPTVVIFDGGLYSNISMPKTEYKNNEGRNLYTLKQMRNFLTKYTQQRATMWALDILAVYMLMHGILSVSINFCSLCKAYDEKGWVPRYPLDIVIAIFMGVIFWFIMANILSKVGMPLH